MGKQLEHVELEELKLHELKANMKALTTEL